jgi:hypothetical protein
MIGSVKAEDPIPAAPEHRYALRCRLRSSALTFDHPDVRAAQGRGIAQGAPYGSCAGFCRPL